jgi:penicillin-binding protein 1C
VTGSRGPRLLRLGRRLGRLALRALLALAALSLVLLILVHVIPLPRLDAGSSVAVEFRDGQVAHVFLSPDDKWRLPVTLEQVDPRFIAALVALEDKRFWRHPGVDLLAVGRALGQNLVHRRRVSGGSTLSMQLARLLEPRRRSVPSKLVEMFRAVQLDTRLSKRQILAAYLTRAPYGGNVEGVEAASLAYFGHGAAHLTPIEIATLLAVPQGPARFAPGPGNVARLRARRDAILTRLIAEGVFAPADAGDALAQLGRTPAPDRLLAVPRHAPHAAAWLAARAPGQTRIRSTLDAGAQLVAESTLRLATPGLIRRGIHAGAVVVVDHRSREVVALVGNLDFDDAAHGGQIAMFDRPRSPGSALKPFLYALAIDRGLALPEHLVVDVPAQYGSYRPRNFDNRWNGLVTLREALSRSLNLPFVALLERLGVESFLGELARMGVGKARAVPGQYGLSLIVGGMEVTPLELAGLYATLAEDGRYLPLRVRADADARAGAGAGVAAPEFGPGAAWLTRQALSLRDRPDFPTRAQVSGVPAEIHWKTGTSFGFRDAWAVGSDAAHTAVVWLGNVDNQPSTELVGSEAAGPILFDTLEALADRAARAARTPSGPPDELAPVAVCAYSGHLATDACPRRVQVLAPVHAVPATPCPYHVNHDVDADTGEAVTPACRLPDHRYQTRSFLVLPSAVTRWLLDQHREVPEAPRFAEGCQPPVPAAAPAIVTPADGQVVMLIPGMPAARQQIPLQADTRSAHVSWFVDGELVATVPSSERVYLPPAIGRHEIVVVDDAGRKGRRALEVRSGQTLLSASRARP